MHAASEPRHEFITAQDGCKLHVAVFGPRASARIPVVCLPGLTRTAEEFTVLAASLAADGHRVIALDSRGRGRSQFDADPAKYSLPIELADVSAVLTAIEAVPAVLIGSSRGGLLTMLLAVLRPTAIAGAVLNDIGPVIETKGLLRLKGYVGKQPVPRNFEEAADIVRDVNEEQFPKLRREDWLAWAHRTWREDANGLVLTFDRELARALDAFAPDAAPPPMWDQFDALNRVPVMVVRGANSDILSTETVAAMRARRAMLETVEVPDQGHTPLLAEADVIARIAAFVARCDR